MQMRRDIPLVCKLWRDIGTEFLYQDVVIRRSSQVFYLARTMESRSHLGFYVTTLSLQCIVESANFDEVSRALLGIVKTTPRIERFSLSNPFWHRYQRDSEYAQDWTFIISEVANLNSSSPSITHLKLAVAVGTKPSLGFNFDILDRFRKLTSLDLDVSSISSSHGGNTVALSDFLNQNIDTGFCLPAVQRFRFSAFESNTSGMEMLPPLTSYMPRLSILILELPGFGWHRGDGASQLLHAIRQCGPKLTTFYIQNTGYLTGSHHGNEEPIPAFDIQHVLDVCPRLEHLTVPISLVHEPLSHTALRWLDICSFPENWSRTNTLWRLTSHQENCPQLVSLRHIDSYLAKLFPEVTLEFTPDEALSTLAIMQDSDSDITVFEREMLAISNTEYAVLTPHEISRYDPWPTSEDESFISDDVSTDDSSNTASADSDTHSDVSSEGDSQDWVLEPWRFTT